MAVSKRNRRIFNSFFEGIETFAANVISNVIELKYLNKYKPKTPIPSEYRRQVKQYWKKYKNISPLWAWYYAARNEILDPRYIPNTIYYTNIDQYFNNRKLGWGFNDKNYYSKIFAGIKQPDVVVRNINGFFLDEDYNLISRDTAYEKIMGEVEVISKPTLETGSGRSICFWNTKDKEKGILEFLSNKEEKDYIVQKVIKQHPELNKVHNGSINSLRIVSILMEDGVHILSSNLRMGVGQSRIDNVTAGGISCGIDADGKLKKYATTYYSGERLEQHPQGLVFEGFKIPSYDKVIAMVLHAHTLIPHFRLVSWDIAICEDGEPMLIEANMRKGGLNLNQFNNGPLFGDLTERVLDEIFGK